MATNKIDHTLVGQRKLTNVPVGLKKEKSSLFSFALVIKLVWSTSIAT